MKNLKKILALAIAVVMIATLGVSVFAAEDMDSEGGVIGEFTALEDLEIQYNAVIIYKEITAYNPETCTVNAPEITYTYTIGAGSSGKNVIDAAGIHVATKAGVDPDDVELTNEETGDNTIVWDNTDTLNASSTGVKNVKPLKIDFSDVEWPGAGVYRYVITETADEYVTSGVVDGTISNTRYLDVYVKDGTTADAPYVIYGYVLSTNDNDIVGDSTATDENSVAAAQKTEGFVEVSDDLTADSYYTFNFSVSKNLTNDSANLTHQFPFTIDLANTVVTGDVLPIMTITGNATQTALTSAAIAGTWKPTIADDGIISYVGIPAGTTVTIHETNDVTGTTYKVTITGADTNPAAANIYTGSDSADAVINNGATAGAAATNNCDVVFTNNLELISPTGVIVRIAPFALILLAGVVLFVIVRRRKVED